MDKRINSAREITDNWWRDIGETSVTGHRRPHHHIQKLAPETADARSQLAGLGPKFENEGNVIKNCLNGMVLDSGFRYFSFQGLGFQNSGVDLTLFVPRSSRDRIIVNPPPSISQRNNINQHRNLVFIKSMVG